MYAELAASAEPIPLTALSEARRLVELHRLSQPPGSLVAQVAEWATPSMSLRGEPAPLYDPKEPLEELAEPAPPRLGPGVVVRGVGDFVGRRTDEQVTGPRDRHWRGQRWRPYQQQGRRPRMSRAATK